MFMILQIKMLIVEQLQFYRIFVHLVIVHVVHLDID